MAALCDTWKFSIGPCFVLWLLEISNRDLLEKEWGNLPVWKSTYFYEDCRKRCWVELELISFSATCWETVIFIALVLLTDNQIVIIISLRPVLLLSDNYYCLDRNLTNLPILRMHSLCLTKCPISSSDASAMFAHYSGLLFLTDSLSQAV